MVNIHEGETSGDSIRAYLPEHQRIPLRINSFLGDTAAVVVIASLAVSLHPLPLQYPLPFFFFISPSLLLLLFLLHLST